MALIDWVVAHLEAFRARISLTWNKVLASFGPDREGVVLSGHTDVVPVDGQNWTSDPFALVERDRRLYGRGTADMLACCLAAVPTFASAPLLCPIHLALSDDEEVGCFGVTRLFEDLVASIPKPAVAIIGEPTSMSVGDRQRGFFASLQLSTAGRRIPAILSRVRAQSIPPLPLSVSSKKWWTGQVWV